MSNSTHSFNPAFEASEEQVDEHLAPEDLDLDEEDEKVKAAEKKVLKEEVWREIILTSNGRDKAFVSALCDNNHSDRVCVPFATSSRTGTP